MPHSSNGRTARPLLLAHNSSDGTVVTNRLADRGLRTVDIETYCTCGEQLALRQHVRGIFVKAAWYSLCVLLVSHLLACPRFFSPFSAARFRLLGLGCT
jgi:hypothetical protein